MTAMWVAGARYSYCSTGRAYGSLRKVLGYFFGALCRIEFNSPPKNTTAVSISWTVFSS